MLGAITKSELSVDESDYHQHLEGRYL